MSAVSMLERGLDKVSLETLLHLDNPEALQALGLVYHYAEQAAAEEVVTEAKAVNALGTTRHAREEMADRLDRYASIASFFDDMKELQTLIRRERARRDSNS